MNGKSVKLFRTSVENDFISLCLEGEPGEFIDLKVRIASGSNRVAWATLQEAGLNRARVLLSLALEALPSG
jgi:hypothetical protein